MPRCCAVERGQSSFDEKPLSRSCFGPFAFVGAFTVTATPLADTQVAGFILICARPAAVSALPKRSAVRAIRGPFSPVHTVKKRLSLPVAFDRHVERHLSPLCVLPRNHGMDIAFDLSWRQSHHRGKAHDSRVDRRRTLGNMRKRLGIGQSPHRQERRQHLGPTSECQVGRIVPNWRFDLVHNGRAGIKAGVNPKWFRRMHLGTISTKFTRAMDRSYLRETSGRRVHHTCDNGRQ